ncbi:unnamed protein product [Phytophthora fragariaefolia]|uniref:Unnamed protein product n=1 Tax=Phytophthora fragariaefolia TaxID=1490495 RepID=A0A9W6YFD6_9STRA|nr:unnamed protein product [Phytophthora fragariaefolia]
MQVFPYFVPNRHDLDILKESCDGKELKPFLGTRPWTKLSDTRRTLACDRLERAGSRLGVQVHPEDECPTAQAHESVRKKVLATQKQLKKIVPASVWNEPGLWKFPKRICNWVLMSWSHSKPGTDASYAMKKQVELLDTRAPARLRWGSCSSDEERIAHLPGDFRRKLIPSGQRDSLDG